MNPTSNYNCLNLKDSDRPKQSRGDLFNLLAVTGICLLFAALRWCKLNTLLREDPSMWLFQVGRAAWGELPYRDFTWNYPPLTMWLFAPWLRFFGVTFQAVQAAIDLLSLLIVLLSYWLLRYLLPKSLHVPVVLVLVAIGATAQTKFTLFSLLTYSPSLNLATIGLLLMMIGIVRYFQSDRLWVGNGLLIAAGAFISQTSKPESLLASGALLALIFIAKTKWRPYLGLLAASTIPALVAYALEAAWVGPENLKAGVTGYGLATFACPWWPTGLGVYGALASLAQTVAIAALASLPLWREFQSRYGRRYRIFLIAAVPCLALYLSYYWYLNRGVLESDHTLKYKIVQVVPLLFWTSPVLLPVMWTGIFLSCYWIWKRPRDPLFVALLVPVVMSSRSLFGTTLYPTTEVSAVCYAFFILTGPVLLWRFLNAAAPRSWRPAAIVGAILVVYAAMRVAGGYQLLANGRYTTLSTNAGDVRLLLDDGSAGIYQYVLAMTQPGDMVLDIPYGGGINFATGRRGPAFSTMYEQLRPTPAHQHRDLDGVRRNPPKVVIADEGRAFHTLYGWHEKMDCPCPRIVWEPDQLSGDPDYTFPLVQYIEDHYRVDRKIGSKIVLVKK